MKKKKNKPVVLQIYDYAQMFDAINLKEAISDVLDTGFIDEENKYILTNFEQVRKGGKAVDSDHATQYMDVNLKINH